MDVDQRERRNPFGMDEDCPNCPALCETRTQVVHGYGDVGADFVFVGGAPGPGPDETGVPFAGDRASERLFDVLARLGLAGEPAREADAAGSADAAAGADDPTGGAAEGSADDATDNEGPALRNTYLTYVTRCRHPERGPTDEEVGNCEPFLNAEVRMINPEVLVPVGALALAEVAREYTTRPAADVDVAADHATTIRGRGFELVPMVDLEDLDGGRADAFVEHFAALMDRDYRQTKGRRGR